MKFGMQASGLGARHYPEVAKCAEDNGFDSIWMPEHLIFPVEMPPKYMYTVDGYPPMKPDTPAFDPFVVLAGVATRTEKIRLGTGVFILPLRNPIMVARSVITLDRMSGGRVAFGIGVGWMPDEFEIVGEEFRNRGARADEMIELIRKLWTEDTIEHHGEYYDIPPVKFAPKPIDKINGIPFIVGGTSKGALRRAGRLGNGWTHHADIHVSLYKGEKNPGTTDADFAELADHMKVINEHRAEAGRMNEPFEFLAGMGQTLDRLKRLEEMGITTANVGPETTNLKGTKDDFMDWIKRFADEVISKF
ncbi:MAG: LLM class F420-dependent oxidoreductase [Acidimicrobiia bacterium]